MGPYEPERINRNVAELSQKLLEGCKLLADSCPETNVPLISTPDGRMYSVGNGCYYARDGASLRKLHAPTMGGGASSGSPDFNGTSHAAHSEPLAAHSQWNGAGKCDSSGDGGGGEGAQGYAATEAAGSLSARVAQKLLEGYTLLTESCPVTNVPLVQDMAGCILSVGTGRWYERRGSELVEVSPPPAAVQAPPLSTPSFVYVPPSDSFSRAPAASSAPIDRRLQSFSAAPSQSSPPTAFAAGIPPPSLPATQLSPAAGPANSSGSPSASLTASRAGGLGAHSGAFSSPRTGANACTFSSPLGVGSPHGSPRAGSFAASSYSHAAAESIALGPTAAGAASYSPAKVQSEAQATLGVLSTKLAETRQALAAAVGTEAAAPHVALIREIASAMAALRSL